MYLSSKILAARVRAGAGGSQTRSLGTSPEPAARWKHGPDTVLLFATWKEWLFIFLYSLKSVK